MKTASWMMAVTLLLTNVAWGQKVADISLGSWTAKSITVEHFNDPVLKGVSCYVSHIHARLDPANPSDGGLSCYQSKPVTSKMLTAAKAQGKVKEVFSTDMSVGTKKLKVVRIWDEANQMVVYVRFTRKVNSASDKQDIATLSLEIEDQDS